MSVSARGMIVRGVVEKLLGASGVSVNAGDVDAVSCSLEPIQSAAAALLQPLSLDETGEHFYRLLEADAANGAGQ